MQASTRWRAVVLGLLAAPALLLSGCGGLSGTGVEQAAARFAAGDAAARCDLLAPATADSLVAEESTSCPEAIGVLPLGRGAVESVAVWGEEAQVKLADCPPARWGC